MDMGMALRCEPETTADAVSASFDGLINMVRVLRGRTEMDYANLQRAYDEKEAALRDMRCKFAELSREYDRLSDECERTQRAWA